MDNPLRHLAELRDPRIERDWEHLLEEILLIEFGGVEWGRELEQHGRLWQVQAGVVEDVFDPAFWHSVARYLQPGVYSVGSGRDEKGFVDWVLSIAQLTAGEVVAIDGKTSFGMRETGKKKLVRIVSAWAEGNGLMLDQRKVDEKSTEITAIPRLLKALELAGAVVTIDAMSCQREIAQLIVEKQAGYVLAVKDKQGMLAEQVRDSFLLLNTDAVVDEVDCAGDLHSGSGRVQQRRCTVIADLSMIEKSYEWASLQRLVSIQSERYHKVTGKIERGIRRCF